MIDDNKFKVEYTKCSLCGSNSTRILYDKQQFKIVKCTKCDLVYVNPRLTEEELKKIYDSEDYYIGEGFGYENYAGQLQNRLRRSHNILTFLERFSGRGKLLDVGCATGSFLMAARERGWETQGVEMSKFSSKYARERYDLNVITGTLENANISKHSFDVITMLDVFEHSRNPLKLLQESKKILKNGSLLFVSVPNFGCLQSRRAKGNWKQLKPHYHLYHFTAKTVSKLLKTAGFKLMDIRGVKEISIERFLSKHGLYGKWMESPIRSLHLNRFFYVSCPCILGEHLDVLAIVSRN